MSLSTFLKVCPKSSVCVDLEGCATETESKKVTFLCRVTTTLKVGGESIGFIRGNLKRFNKSGETFLDMANTANKDFPNSALDGLDEIGVDTASIKAWRETAGPNGVSHVVITSADGKLKMTTAEVAARSRNNAELSEQGRAFAALAAPGQQVAENKNMSAGDAEEAMKKRLAARK
jgi:hypothetical protein